MIFPVVQMEINKLTGIVSKTRSDLQSTFMKLWTEKVSSKMFTVESCCGWVGLRTGGLIIGYMKVIALFLLSFLLSDQRDIATVFMLYITLNYSWIYAIHHNKPKWMIPYLVVTMLKIIGLLVLFVYSEYDESLYLSPSDGYTHYHRGTPPFARISLLLYTAFEVFLMVVSYSLYRSMAKENYQQVTYAHQLGTVNSTMSHDEGLKTIPLNTNYIV